MSSYNYRSELNEKAKIAISQLVEQDPERWYWTIRELFDVLEKEGFSSKKDVAVSMKVLRIPRRVITVNGKVSRCYQLRKVLKQ